MSYYVVDVESDGPIPGKYSMISFGAVKVDANLDKTFYGTTSPISEFFNAEAAAISNTTRELHWTYDQPSKTMQKFKDWIEATTVGHPIFISDNLAYDWQWINYYFHLFTDDNPFGYSGRRLGDLYCGIVKDSRARWKHLRKTVHTHHPVDDAKGNAEVLLHLMDMGLKIKLD